MVKRFNIGLKNANKYLNMGNSIFKKNQIPSAHHRYGIHCKVFSEHGTLNGVQCTLYVIKCTLTVEFG